MNRVGNGVPAAAGTKERRRRRAWLRAGVLPLAAAMTAVSAWHAAAAERVYRAILLQAPQHVGARNLLGAACQRSHAFHIAARVNVFVMTDRRRKLAQRRGAAERIVGNP